MKESIFNKPNLKKITWRGLGFMILILSLAIVGCTKSKQGDSTVERASGSNVARQKSSGSISKDPKDAASNGSESRYSGLILQKELAFLGVDLFSPYAWHLVNLGQSIDQEQDGSSTYTLADAIVPGNDIHFSNAVQSGYTGRDISVLISSDGIESSHEDLAVNFWKDHSREFGKEPPTAGEDKIAEPKTKYDNEGTALAGLIGAAANNNIGTRGVAPGVKMASANFASSAQEVATEKSKNLGSAKTKQASGGFDIFFQGWNDERSRTSYVSASEDYLKQLKLGVTNGRDNKGSSFIKGAGDYFLVEDSSRQYVGNSNFEGDQSSPYIVTVSALDARGIHASYSSPGANIWISAPGGEDGMKGPGLLTTDRSGCDLGLATTEIKVHSRAFDLGEKNNKNCSYTGAIYGTRAAAAILSGSVALIMEAARGVNNILSWRDVKHILASTATKVDLSSASVEIKHPSIDSPPGYVWEQGWVKNKSPEGYRFHNWYGFGRVNVDAAICMATHYNGSLGSQLDTIDRSTGQEEWKYYSKTDLNLTTPDNSKDGATSIIEVSEDYKIEAIQVRVKVTHAQVGQLALELESPSGTKNILINANNSLTLGNVANFNGNEVFLINAFYGELSKGKWTIRVIDAQAGIDGKLDRWGINIIGRDPAGTTPLPCSKDELTKMGIAPDSSSDDSGSFMSSVVSFFGGGSSRTNATSGGLSSKLETSSTSTSTATSTATSSGAVILPSGNSTEEPDVTFYSQFKNPNIETLKNNLSGYVMKASLECKDFRITGQEVIPGLGVSKVRRICQKDEKYTPVESTEEYIWFKDDGSFISFMSGCIDKERKQNRKAEILGSGKWSIEKIKSEEQNLLKFWGTYRDDYSSDYSNNYTAKLVLRDNSGKIIGWKSSLVGLESPLEHSQGMSAGTSVISYNGIHLLDWVSNGDGGPHVRWQKFSNLHQTSSEDEATNACWYLVDGSSRSYSALFSDHDLIWPLQNAVLMPVAECRDYRVAGKGSGGFGQSEKSGFCENDSNFTAIENSGEYLWLLYGGDFLSYRPGCMHPLMIDKTKKTPYFKLGAGKWAVEEFDVNSPDDLAMYNALGIKKKNQFRQKITFRTSDESKKVGWKDHLAAFSGPLRSRQSYKDKADDYFRLVEWIYQENGKPYFKWIKWKTLGETSDEDKATSSCASDTLLPKRKLPAPSIKEFYPAIALAGDTVTIEGANFGTDETSVEITVGGMPVEQLKEHTDTSVKLLVPNGAVTGVIQVKIGDQVAKTSSTLWVPKKFRILARPTEEHIKYGLKQSDSSYILYPGDQLEFDSELEWALPVGAQASSFGTPPVPNLTTSWSSAGQFLFDSSRVFRANHIPLWQENASENVATISAYLHIPGPTLRWYTTESQNTIDVHVLSHDCPMNYIPISVRSGPGDQKAVFIEGAKKVLQNDSNFFIADDQNIAAQAKNSSGYYVKINRVGTLDESYKALRNGSRCATFQPTYEFKLLPFAETATIQKNQLRLKMKFDYFDGSSVSTWVQAPAEFTFKNSGSYSSAQTYNTKGNNYSINLTYLKTFTCAAFEMGGFKSATVYSNLKACRDLTTAVQNPTPFVIQSEPSSSKPGYIADLAIKTDSTLPAPFKKYPEVIGFYPSVGRVGDAIDIMNENMGAGVSVTLGGKPVEIIGREENLLRILIPDEAVSGKIKVAIGNTTIESSKVLWVLEDFTISAKYKNPWEDRGLIWDFSDTKSPPAFDPIYDSISFTQSVGVYFRSYYNFNWLFRYKEAWLYEGDDLEFNALVKWKLPSDINEQALLGNPPGVSLVSQDYDTGDFGKDNERNIFKAKKMLPDRYEDENYTTVYAAIDGSWVYSSNAVVVDVFEDKCYESEAAIDARYYPQGLEDDMDWKKSTLIPVPIAAQTKLIWRNEIGKITTDDGTFSQKALISDIFNVKINQTETIDELSKKAEAAKGYSIFAERKSSGTPLRLGSRCVQVGGVTYAFDVKDYTGQSITKNQPPVLPVIFEESAGDKWSINQIGSNHYAWKPDANSIFKCIGVGFTHVNVDDTQTDYRVTKVFSNLKGCEELDPMKSEIVQHLAFGGKIEIKLNQDEEAISDQYAPIVGGKAYTVYYQKGKFVTQTPPPESKVYIEGNASVHLFSHEISILGHVGLLGDDWRDGKIYSYHDKKVVGTYSLLVGEGLRTLDGKESYSPVIERFYHSWGVEGSVIKIYGSNFDPPGVSGTDFEVLFGGDVKAIILNRTNYEVEVMVPPGAVSGPIKVKLNGRLASSSTPFWVMGGSDFVAMKIGGGRDDNQVTISLNQTANVQVSPWIFPTTGEDSSWKQWRPLITYRLDDPEMGSFIDDKFIPRKTGTAIVRASIEGVSSSAMLINVTCDSAMRAKITEEETPVIDHLEVQSGIDLNGDILTPNQNILLTIHGKNLDDASCLTEKKKFDVTVGGEPAIKSGYGNDYWGLTERKSNIIKLWVNENVKSGFVQVNTNGVVAKSNNVLWIRKNSDAVFTYRFVGARYNGESASWRGGSQSHAIFVGDKIEFKGPEWIMPADPSSIGTPPEISFTFSDSSDPEVGNFAENVFTAKKVGTVTIQPRLRGVTIDQQNLSIQVQ